MPMVGHLAETVHCMGATKKAFRLIVVRCGTQVELFEDRPCRIATPWSSAIVTATMAWYCQRGEASENRIKELKIGYGMERMPCGQFEANAVFFRLGVLAYKLFKGFT